jgi:hypothetical protein
MTANGLEKGATCRRSGLRPVARCCDLTDGIQAGQLKRAFMRRTFASVHLYENLAAIRHRAQETNDVAWKGETCRRFRGSPALLNRRLSCKSLSMHFNRPTPSNCEHAFRRSTASPV